MPLTNRELAEISRANCSDRTPVVFVHGLWLGPESWQPWRDRFAGQGYATLAPGWPDEARGIDEVTAHHLEVIALLDRAPVVVGHSFGGLIAQQIAGQGVAAATVAIGPVPSLGLLPVPLSSLKCSFAVPRGPGRDVAISFEQFRYGWANALPDDQAQLLYAGLVSTPAFRAVAANLNAVFEVRVDTNHPGRGPLLIVSGAADHTIPTEVSFAAYEMQRFNPGVTTFAEVPGRGHALTIDHGWPEVARTALAFLEEHARTCQVAAL